MPNDFLSGLGLAGQNPDYNSPLQSELSAAMMKALTSGQMNYDPNVRGGWTASMVNALRDVNAGFYRNQALRANQNVSQDFAQKLGNVAIGAPQNKPAMLGRGTTGSINPGQGQGTVAPVKNISPGPQDIDMAPEGDQGQQQDFATVTKDPWAALTIKNGVDENAPYMGRPRDEANTKRIVFHGDVKDHVDDITGANGKVDQGLLNYGRKVDPQRNFDPNYHFYIDKDGTITQGVPLDRTANHVGKYNSDSIGIVLAGVVGGKKPTPEQLASATQLSGALADKYDLTQSNVVKHPELMPGHRAADESGDVAPMIRKYGFDQSNWPAGPTEQNRIETAALPLNRKSIEQAKNVKLAANEPVLAPRLGGFANSNMASQVTPSVNETPDTGGRQDTLTRSAMNPAWNIKSNLGGPQQQDQSQGQNGQQVAQNYANPSQLSSGNTPAVRGLESPEELRALLASPMVANDPKMAQEIVDSYRKRAEPYNAAETAFGPIQATPTIRGQAPEARQLPSGKESAISVGGMSIPMYPMIDANGQQGFKLKIPGAVGSKLFGDAANKVYGSPGQAQDELGGLFDLAHKGQQLSAEGAATSQIYGEKAKTITDAIKEGQAAPEVLKTLNTMSAMNKTNPNGIFMHARQLMGNMGLPVKDSTAIGESFEKFTNFLASQATQAITSRGTNFELSTFINSVPALKQTPQGRQMIIDILKQEYAIKQKIGLEANNYKGQDADKFMQRVQQIYKENPIKFTYQGKRVNTYPLDDVKEEDLDKYIAKGEAFVNPDTKKIQLNK